MNSESALANYTRYRNDPWLFLTECVYTLDQVSEDNPIKLFPDKDYLRFYTRMWQSYKLLLVPKTRRMTMSWATISLYVWDAMFHKGRFFAFVSKKEEDADELVKRAEFIIKNIDRNKIPEELIPKYKKTYCALEFPALNSKIQGFPQGADQLRQFTFSGIFGDECAFWEKAQEFYAASLPTLDGGGRMTLVSSPAPGFFKRICFDALDNVGDINVAEYAPDYKAPLQGIRLWQNRKNKFLVFELHYTADPGKRAPEYKESIKNSMPLQEYLREYELHWDTFSGFPVYPEYSKLHETDEYPYPVSGLPMLIGIDFGLTPAAVIGQYIGERLYIYKEFVELNMGAERFMEKITDELRLLYPEFSDFKKNWRCFIDPSGFFRKDTDESKCSEFVEKYFTPAPGPVAWEGRRHAVVEFLRKMSKDGPSFQIYSRECPVTVKGFMGGYKFSDKSAAIEPNKVRPEKNEYSHPHDALQYLCAGVKSLVYTMKRTIPKPSYSITNEKRNMS